MYPNQTYYQNSDEWCKRTHILPDNNSWRRDWPQTFRDDLIVTPAGLFIVRREDDYTYSRPATLEDARAFFAPPPDSKRWGGVQLPAKVPFSMLRRALIFFTEVWRKQAREDVLLLYFSDTTLRYRLAHPRLKSAGFGHVDYEMPVTPAGWTHFGSLHSHGHERAYHSAMDAVDDLKSPGLHIVVGSLNSQLPSLHCIFSHNGHCFGVPTSDVFVDDWMKKISFPSEWMQASVPVHPRPARSTAASDSALGGQDSVSRTE